MTTNDYSPRTKPANWITYVVLGVIFIALTIIALAVFRSAKDSVDANAKADQLISTVQAKGYPAPSKDQIVQVLGTDGGAVCADPGSALKHAIFNGMLVNGAAGPGIRPIIADNRAIQGQALIMNVYCPEKLPDFAKYVEKYKSANLVKS